MKILIFGFKYDIIYRNAPMADLMHAKEGNKLWQASED